MISLYPSHIPISFPYPYISHIHKSFIIFACCPATCFFIFHFFCGVGETGCRGVFFLWFFGVGIVDVFRPFLVSFVVPSFAPFRPSVRFSSRPSVRFPVSLLAPPFDPLHRFVFPFGRVEWAVCVVYRFILLFWIGWGFVLFRASVSWRRCGKRVSLMRAVRWMAWLGVYAGRMAFRVAWRVACRLARCWAGCGGVCGIWE